jgi:hypothetical protein
MTKGLPLLKNGCSKFEGCIIGKIHRKEFPTYTDMLKKYILEFVHMDVHDPMQTISLGGACYFFIFIDDCKRYTWVYFPRKKSDVFEYFKNIVEKQTKKYINIL